MLAESEGADWPWVLEAWRQLDRDGVERTFYAVRGSQPGGMAISQADLAGDAPLRAQFEQRDGGDDCLLFGPVAPGVAAVTVEPLEPEEGPPREAKLTGDEAGLGRFFVHAFDRTVERARVSVEPAGSWKHSSTLATNIRAAHRRQIADGVVIGTGKAPDGRHWRLRVWLRGPSQIHVDLQMAEDPARFELFDRMGVTGAGYGAPPPTPDKLIKLSAMGGRVGGLQHVIGEVAPTVAGARVRFEDGHEVDAQIVRTDVVEHDYFLAFEPSAQEVTAVAALDEQGRVCAEEERSAESLRASWEFKQRRRG